MPRLWTAQEVDCLLSHMELHKGPNGKWAKHFGEGSDEVQVKLQTIKPPGAASLTKEFIRGKIRTIASRLLSRGQGSLQVLFFKGPVALQLRDRIFVGRGRTPASTVAGLRQAIEMSDCPRPENVASSAEACGQRSDHRGTEPYQLDDNHGQGFVFDDQQAITDATSLYMPDGADLSPFNELCGSRGRRLKSASRNPTAMHVPANIQAQAWTTGNLDRLQHPTGTSDAISRDGDEVGPTMPNADSFPPPRFDDIGRAMRTGLQEASNCENQTEEQPRLEEWERQILGTFRKAFDVAGHVESQSHA